MAKQQTEKPYYQQFQRVLGHKLEEILEHIEPESRGQLFANLSTEASILKSLEEGITRYPLRYYQKEALYTLHHIYNQAIDVCKSPGEVQKNLLKQKSYEHIKPLLEEVDEETGKRAPFIGFEMATGSGKTMLMGAAIYYLYRMHGVKNFLVITPSSTEIYKKTIRNFQKGSKETVWDADVPFSFNLVNGDNFQDTKDLYHSDTDANIFVFNIDKFGSNAKQTKKKWENSVWKDKNNSTISLLEFLSLEDLVIITDEAHHAQSRKSQAIISAFKPMAVLEFTATAVEAEKNSGKKNQTIVYKYDIRRFLDDKYGKKVRVLALPGQEETRRARREEIDDIEKYKLQLFFLVHLVKKRALLLDRKSRDMKCIGFVKIKNEIRFAEKVEQYIKAELASDTLHLEVVLEKAKNEDTETTNLILEMFKQDYGEDITRLQEAIRQAAQTTILLHSKSDPQVRKDFDDIQRNKIEIVAFIDMLNEGIDMPNIYSMVVVNDTPSEFKTSVKQIVGRGVRLFKEQREYDDVENNDLLTHVEKLHIICDKGASFEEVIMQIQKEFGLNERTFAVERGEIHSLDNPVKRNKLQGIQLPKIKVDFKRKEGASILNTLTNYTKIFKDFAESNCFAREFEGEKLLFLKYTPNSFFTEVDLFTDAKVFHQMGESLNWTFKRLVLGEKDTKEIYSRVISKLKPIPDVPRTYKIFREYTEEFNKAGLCYYHLDAGDEKIINKRFKDSFFYFYIRYVENDYFELDLDTLDSESDSWLLSDVFKTSRIKLRKLDIENKARHITDESDLIARIKDGYYFYGYEHSVNEYNKFDTLPEKQLADYINYCIEKELPGSESAFWVRNERNLYFEYGTHRYYPDFIFFYRKIIYVIEIKGDIYSNRKKNRLLIELNKVPGMGKVESYRGLVVFQLQMKRLKDLSKDFNDFIKEAEAYFDQVQARETIIPSEEVNDEQKYISYVPAYDTSQTYKKFVQKDKVDPDGWLPVDPVEGGYSKEIFAVMVKNDDLGVEEKNKWVLFRENTSKSVTNLENKEVLCYHPKIQDEDYSKNQTIKNFSIRKKSVKIGMFDDEEITVFLTDSKGEKILEISKDLDKFMIIGVRV